MRINYNATEQTLSFTHSHMEKDRLALIKIYKLLSSSIKKPKKLRKLQSSQSVIMHQTLQGDFSDEDESDASTSSNKLQTQIPVDINALTTKGILLSNLTIEKRSEIFKIIYVHYDQVCHFLPKIRDEASTTERAQKLAIATGKFFSTLTSEPFTILKPNKSHETKLKEIISAQPKAIAQELIYTSTYDRPTGSNTFSFLFHPHNEISVKVFNDLLVNLKQLFGITDIPYQGASNLASIEEAHRSEKTAKLRFFNGFVNIRQYTGKTLESQHMHIITVSRDLPPDEPITPSPLTPTTATADSVEALFAKLLTDKYDLKIKVASSSRSMPLFEKLERKIGTGYTDHAVIPVKFNLATTEVKLLSLPQVLQPTPLKSNASGSKASTSSSRAPKRSSVSPSGGKKFSFTIRRGSRRRDLPKTSLSEPNKTSKKQPLKPGAKS